MNKNDNRTQLLHTLKVTFKILDWQYYKKKKKKQKKKKKKKKKKNKNKKKTVTEPFKIKLPAARASKGKKKKFSMSIDANNFRRKHIFYVIMSFSSSKFIFKITT